MIWSLINEKQSSKIFQQMEDLPYFFSDAHMITEFQNKSKKINNKQSKKNFDLLSFMFVKDMVFSILDCVLQRQNSHRTLEEENLRRWLLSLLQGRRSWRIHESSKHARKFVQSNGWHDDFLEKLWNWFPNDEMFWRHESQNMCQIWWRILWKRTMRNARLKMCCNKR